MTQVYRVDYEGVCEVWVEVEGTTVTKVLTANASSVLIGCQLDDLPMPSNVQVKLLA